MIKLFKILSLLFLLSFSSNVNAKPVPPGAGGGDVAANILFLVDSSASMGRWIGGDGIGPVAGVAYDSQNRILFSQYSRRTAGAIIRYNANGRRDNSFRPIRAIPRAGCAQFNDNSVHTRRGLQRQRKAAHVEFVENLDSVSFNESVIFFHSQERNTRGYIFGFSEDGRRCLIALRAPGGMSYNGFDIQEVGGVPYLFAAGGGRRAFGFFMSCNLETFVCNEQNITDTRSVTRWAGRLSVNNEGTMVYFSNRLQNNLEGYALTQSGDAFTLGTRQRQCTASNAPNLTSELAIPFGVEVSPADSSIVYTTSVFSHAIQKIQISNSTTNSCTIITGVGSGSRTNLSNEGSANALDADNVGFNQPHALGIGYNAADDRYLLLTGTARGYIDEFHEDKFTAIARNTTWVQQMGGPRIRRWDGVKSAINAIVNDTTLTTGAYFGFGHWNAGEHGRSRTAAMGGRHCHRTNDCTYYQGWNGDHPEGTSIQCNRDSCLNVAVSPRGSDQIMDVMAPLGMAWGTDANAFSQIAEDYFMDQDAGGKILNPDADCQINYVIVIGDGAMRNTGLLGDTQRGFAAERMARLREQGVKSLYVAYGGGINGTSLNRFHELSRIGTSTLPAGTTAQECIDDEDCERAIVARTPERLKTVLTSKIRQIIADKLAFTAPSITATIEEGGSLYQAQFGYEQFGEWQGRILRKKLLSPAQCPDTNEDCVEHNTLPGNPHKNWDSSLMIRRQSTPGGADDGRNIWTAMPGAPYLGNWDNFTQDQSTAITNLFNLLGYEVDDYHTSTSNCSDIGSDATEGDETIGLINFMKGNDYFDYDGDCVVSEVRDHVMGDVYHSQLVEVGPPDMNLNFTSFNEEAYHRSTRGYARFKVEQAKRLNVIYAGANSGILHAIAAKSGNGYQGGEEIWGFIPPFVAAKLPQIINPEYDKSSGGGTNPIFGVDGSPVIHDAFIRGYNFRGELEGSRSWRTLLFIPYGRGGAGFSLLDVTDPIPSGTRGPIHMVSVFNDRINNRVLVADVLGRISAIEYNSTSSSLMNSSEGEVATDNYNDAREKTELNPNDADYDADALKNIAVCSTASDFRTTGTASCYRGNTFYFPDLVLDYPTGEEIPQTVLGAVKLKNGVPEPISITSAQMSDDGSGGSVLKVVFKNEQVFNANPSDEEPTLSDDISVRACIGGSGIDPAYDYSRLGETWSTPKIVRMPSSSGSTNIGSDRYVAIMGAGMSKGDACAGSALFVIDLEGHMDGMPGRIYGSEINGGPINIVDTTPNGILSGDVLVETNNGSNIPNAIPAAPLVITPDTAPGVPWRGALVYVNDLEGKITKINLTNNTKGLNDLGNLSSGVTELYDQTTLFRLGSTRENARYSFFSMEAGLGVTDKSFWLFGSTGNFIDLGGKSSELDNILYGVQDKHFPYWKHLNGVTVPKIVMNPGNEPMEINPDFLRLAHEGADKASNVGNAFNCVNVSGDTDGDNCPIPDTADAWVIHLEKNQNNAFLSPRTFRKASAPPTLFKGIVYYPIYQPPPGSAPCAQGHSFICAADDECGTNSSELLKLETPGDINNPGKNACAYVSEGVLSELVVFGDKLFANVAGPSEDESTLFSVFSVPGEILSNKGGWRDSGF